MKRPAAAVKTAPEDSKDSKRSKTSRVTPLEVDTDPKEVDEDDIPPTQPDSDHPGKSESESDKPKGKVPAKGAPTDKTGKKKDQDKPKKLKAPDKTKKASPKVTPKKKPLKAEEHGHMGIPLHAHKLSSWQCFTPVPTHKLTHDHNIG